MKGLYLFLGLSLLLILSCSKDEYTYIDFGEPENPYSITIHQEFIHATRENYQSQVCFCPWMLSEDHIANWKGNYDFDLCEPVNVIWVDYKAKEDQEAKDNIVDFLIDSGFSTRGFSSIGYYTIIDGIQIEQYPADVTWSDKNNPFVENNHARVFISARINDIAESPVFYTLGCFSRESFYDHDYISFNQARDVLTISGNWIEEESVKLKNIHNSSNSIDQCEENGFDYSTMDHDETRVFALFP